MKLTFLALAAAIGISFPLFASASPIPTQLASVGVYVGSGGYYGPYPGYYPYRPGYYNIYHGHSGGYRQVYCRYNMVNGCRVCRECGYNFCNYRTYCSGNHGIYY